MLNSFCSDASQLGDATEGPSDVVANNAARVDRTRVPAPTSASTCAKNAVSAGCCAIVVESLEREVEGLESVQALAWERAGLSVCDETREFSIHSPLIAIYPPCGSRI